MHRFLVISVAAVAALVFASCSSDAPEAPTAAGVRTVAAAEASDVFTSASDDLVVLDVRTPEEFDEARLEGSTMLDFYEADFADQLAELDRDVPYLLYCRSGNRSGQTAMMMQELGFSDVTEIEGGIVAWMNSGHPVVSP